MIPFFIGEKNYRMYVCLCIYCIMEQGTESEKWGQIQ